MAHPRMLSLPALFALAVLATAVQAPLPAAAQNAGPAGKTLALAVPQPASVLVRLRSRVTVDDKIVTLGDLFEGASGPAAARPFAVAPEPGQQLSFRIGQVAAAARAAGLDWTPDANQRLVSISRAATYVPQAEIMAQLDRALSARTGGRDTMVQIAGRVPQLAVATNVKATVRVDQLQYDPQSGQFSAMLAAPADDADARRVPIQGRVSEAVQVPVPANRIDPGQIIGKNDLRWIEVPANRIDRNAVTDLVELVGKAAKRSLPEGRPVRVNDVQRPSLVAKGALVTVTLDAPNMSLSTMGRAVEAGGKGDFVQVLNLQSHKTIVGTVIGPNLVAIQNGRIVSAANR